MSLIGSTPPMVPSPLGLRVLHGLRLKGFVEAGFLADFVGMETAEVERRLGLAGADGFAIFRDGARSGWSLTAEGRKEHDRQLAVELDESGHRADVESAYRDFLVLNGRMLEACTRWQVKDQDSQTLNNHDDPAYDAEVISELQEIDAAVQPICAVLGGWFDRFSDYGPRFTTAVGRLSGGEIDWFTKPTIESYHTVWFELHEDLLVTLGIDRASERV
ncbi:MAG: transcriptional regulator [Acidimicrobiales bacterium]